MRQSRKSLQDERARLQGGLMRCKVLMQAEGDRPGRGTDLADDAMQAFEQAKTLAVSQCLSQTLESVNRALSRMDEGTYGVCEHCGERINPARLDVLPYATLCVGCQSRAEKRAAFR